MLLINDRATSQTAKSATEQEILLAAGETVLLIRSSGPEKQAEKSRERLVDVIDVFSNFLFSLKSRCQRIYCITNTY